MRGKAIISRSQSLRILRNTFRKAAIEERAAELRSASAEERRKLLARIDEEVDKKMKDHMVSHPHWSLFA